MKNKHKINGGFSFLFFWVVLIGFWSLVHATDPSIHPGKYVVQLNAFTIESNAQNSIKKWKSKGYPVFLDHDEGERWFKIRIGPYGNWEEARKVSLNLKNKERLSPLVLLTFGGERKLAAPVSLLPQNETPIVKSDEPVREPEGENGNPKSKIESDSADIDAVDRVVARFMEWKTAWQKKDIPTYLQFYSPSFDSGAKSLLAWERSRAKALSKEGKILIDVAEVQILSEGQQVEMSFIQKFKSRRFSDVGHKTLVWRFEKGDWHIVSERWLPI